jgi:hypothetical protein
MTRSTTRALGTVALAVVLLPAIAAWGLCPGPNDCFRGANCDQYVGDGTVCTVDACGSGGNGICGTELGNPVKQCRRQPGQTSCPTVECRVASCPLPSGCDRAGLCIGQGTCIQSPAPGQSCNDGNVCTTNDVCVGTPNPVCAGTPTPGAVCRAAAGPCDVAETCAAATCPLNAFQPKTTVCRPAAGACDVAETCTGSSAACPGDALASSTTVCRPAAGACDVAETCTGDSAACPPDTVLPDTTVCRAAAGACDVAESCTGMDPACPPQGEVRGMSCGSGEVSACDGADTCAGQGVCLTNHAPIGASCPDDGNICTDDVCDGEGTCQHVANSAPCDDGDACTTNDTCLAGDCVGTGKAGCAACRDAQDGAPCDDGDACTAPDTCRGGACVGMALSGTACDDGNACTEQDECASGTCRGRPVTCDDGDPCTQDACDAVRGCVHSAAGAEGDACDDGDPCTEPDACESGTCAGQRICGLDLPPGSEQPVNGNASVKIPCTGGPADKCSAELFAEAQISAGATPASVRGGVLADQAPGLVRISKRVKAKKLRRRRRVVLRLKLTRTGRKLLAGAPNGLLPVLARATLSSRGQLPRLSGVPLFLHARGAGR